VQVSYLFGLKGNRVDLWRGITGFWDTDDPPLPASDFETFSQHCHIAARSLGGTVRVVQTPSSQASVNFAEVILETRDGAIVVLLNAHFPIVAFARAREKGEMRFHFVDVPAVATLFKTFGSYEVLTSMQARKPLTPDDSLQLGRAEIKQLRYWQPRTIGEVVFSFWD
jgi:hypothetical protein